MQQRVVCDIVSLFWTSQVRILPHGVGDWSLWENYVTGAQLDCPKICSSSDCLCPQGMVVFRDGYVDPLECYSLLHGQLLPVVTDTFDFSFLF